MNKRITSLLLFTSLLLASCDGGAPAETTAADTGDTTAAAPTDPYNYPAIDLGGGELHILNSSTTWGFHTTIDLESATGDVLDDVIYNRNRDFEERFNLKLNVTEASINDTAEMARTTILAGDDVYDACWLRGDLISSVVTEGLAADLSDIDALQLSEPWWDQSVMEGGSITKDGSICIASNNICLMGLGGSVCVFINESMMEDLKLNKPYDLVRSGKWTLDALRTYTKAGANLNGADSFDYVPDKDTTYGLVTWYDGIEALCIGAGWRYIGKENGEPVLVAGDEHFHNVAAKVASLVTAAGEFCEINNRTESKHYEMAFQGSRSLMMIAELKAASGLRSFNDTFGIVPTPKYDESQKDYCTFVSSAQSLMCIPVTVADKEETGALIDTLAYLSYRDVLPVFYETTVEQKELRNDDSIEMLDIIRDSRYFDTAYAYGWTNYNTRENVRKALKTGDGSVASALASIAPGIETKIAATLDMLK